MLGKGKTLSNKVVLDYRKGPKREEVGRDIQVACVMGTSGKGCCSEAMRGHVGEGSGEDGVFGCAVWRR